MFIVKPKMYLFHKIVFVNHFFYRFLFFFTFSYFTSIVYYTIYNRLYRYVFSFKLSSTNFDLLVEILIKIKKRNIPLRSIKILRTLDFERDLNYKLLFHILIRKKNVYPFQLSLYIRLLNNIKYNISSNCSILYMILWLS